MSCSVTNGPNSLLKDILTEEGCPWLIKCTTQGNPNDVRLFDMPPYVTTKHVDDHREEIDPTPQGPGSALLPY